MAKFPWPNMSPPSLPHLVRISPLSTTHEVEESRSSSTISSLSLTTAGTSTSAGTPGSSSDLKVVDVTAKYPCVGKLLQPLIGIAAAMARIEPVVPMATPLPAAESKMGTLQELREYKDLLLSDLVDHIGADRTEELYKLEVQQHHFLLLYADEDSCLGEEMRDQLKVNAAAMGHQLSVVGPWNVKLGEQILTMWERLSIPSREVVVIVSHALFRNTEITQCLMKMDISLVTPVYLEPLTSKDFPPYLASLQCRNGRSAHYDKWDLHIFVKDLLTHYNFHKHLVKEITILKNILCSREITRLHAAAALKDDNY